MCTRDALVELIKLPLKINNRITIENNSPDRFNTDPYFKNVKTILFTTEDPLVRPPKLLHMCKLADYNCILSKTKWIVDFCPYEVFRIGLQQLCWWWIVEP